MIEAAIVIVIVVMLADMFIATSVITAPILWVYDWLIDIFNKKD